ncbi:MAG: hypothetical protein FWG72_09790 [Oscillospiraceae bacterium]|nr:hypothetical protein [Oscillospiraceae bacterium]
MNEILRRKQSWLDLYSGKTKRLFVANVCRDDNPRPLLWWENADARVEYAVKKYHFQMECLGKIPDSSIPYLDMITGTEIFAEAFGCGVFRPEDNNPAAIPCVANASEAAKIKIPNLEDTNLSILFDMADKARSRTGNDAMFKFPDIQTPMDIAALIWEKTDFFASMYEDPEAIKELCHKIKLFMFDFLDKWIGRYGKEHIAHYPDYYIPEGITVSEDELGAVSPEMFDAFFLDELNRFSERYGSIGIHCCAGAKHQWENLKKVKHLRLLNLNLPHRDMPEAYECFKASCVQFHGVFGGYDELSDLLDKIPAEARAAFWVDFGSLNEAVEFTKKMIEKFNEVKQDA